MIGNISCRYPERARICESNFREAASYVHSDQDVMILGLRLQVALKIEQLYMCAVASWPQSPRPTLTNISYLYFPSVSPYNRSIHYHHGPPNSSAAAGQWS
jgi:hypothetical protein